MRVALRWSCSFDNIDDNDSYVDHTSGGHFRRSRCLLANRYGHHRCKTCFLPNEVVEECIRLFSQMYLSLFFSIWWFARTWKSESALKLVRWCCILLWNRRTIFLQSLALPFLDFEVASSISNWWFQNGEKETHPGWNLVQIPDWQRNRA